jgi:hypothetical protein
VCSIRAIKITTIPSRIVSEKLSLEAHISKKNAFFF